MAVVLFAEGIYAALASFDDGEAESRWKQEVISILTAPDLEARDQLHTLASTRSRTTVCTYARFANASLHAVMHARSRSRSLIESEALTT